MSAASTAAVVIWTVLTGGVGMLMALARTNPQEASSNLSKWVEWLGIKTIPAWLRDSATDRWVYRRARGAFWVLVVAGAATAGIYLFALRSAPLCDRNTVYQAHVLVGEAFGARRDPADATLYTFVEITNASKLNIHAPIECDCLVLQIQSADSYARTTPKRPEVGEIYKGVIAEIIKPSE